MSVALHILYGVKNEIRLYWQALSLINTFSERFCQISVSIYETVHMTHFSPVLHLYRN